MTWLKLAAMLAAALSGGFLFLSFVEPAPRLAPHRAPLWVRIRGAAAGLWQRLEAWLELACLPMEPALFTLLAGSALLLVSLALTTALGWQSGLAFFTVALWLLRFALMRRISSRGRYLAAELPIFLRLVAGRLRTGFSLLQSLEIAAHEGPQRLGAEMQRLIGEVNMGTSLEVALERLRARLQHPDIDLAVTAMLISREVGGNLSESMATLADTMHQRGRLRRQIRVLTAQPRLSGVIVALLPFFVLAVMTAINPEFTLVLVRTKLGWVVMGVALLSQAVGIWLIRRIIKVGEDLLT